MSNKKGGLRKFIFYTLLITLLAGVCFLAVVDIPAPKENVVETLDGKQYYDKPVKLGE